MTYALTSYRTLVESLIILSFLKNRIGIIIIIYLPRNYYKN